MTGRIPLDEQGWIPPSLRDCANAPTFIWRRLEGREWRELHRQAFVEGFRDHSTDELREVVLQELAKIWPPATFKAETPRIRRIWIRIDAGKKLKAADQEALDELSNRLRKASPRFENAVTETARYPHILTAVAVSIAVKGWAALRAPFRLAEGRIPLATVAAAKEALDAFDRANDIPQPGGWFDLSRMAVLRLRKAAGMEPAADSAIGADLLRPRVGGPATSKGKEPS
jgi:hypothetical protein